MSDTKNYITSPGEVNVTRLEIKSSNGKLLDISAIFADLTLYEDIFSNTMSGFILMQDSLDLLNILPMTGEELLFVDLQTPTLKQQITKTFYIYKMSALSTDKRKSTYILHFCSLELINSLNTKISKSFKNNISDTITTILKDEKFLGSQKTFVCEKTSNSYNVVVPYWTPLQTINWLSTKSLNNKNTSNFLFFENNKEFRYSSIDLMVAANPTREYINSDVNSHTITDDNEKKYSIVELIEMPITYDYIRNLSAGMYGGILYTYDLTTKNIKKSTYDYIDRFDLVNHTNKAPLRTNSLFRNTSASLNFSLQNNYLNGSFNSQKIHDTLLQRSSLLEQISAFRINIRVYGRTDIKAGQTITYKTPKTAEIVKKEINTDADSEYFSGKYLITAIKHSITNGQHKMDMEIVSDSFVTNISNNK